MWPCKTETRIMEVGVKRKANQRNQEKIQVNAIPEGVDFHCCSVQEKDIFTSSLDSREKISLSYIIFSDL